MKNDNKTINQLLDKIERLNTKIFLQKKDISVFKQTIVKIQDENKITNIALDTQLDTFFLFDPITSKAVQWNKSFAKISGYTDDEIAKLPAPTSYYSPEDLERAGKFIQNILKGNSGNIELELICKDGQKIPFEYQVVAINDEKGEPKNLISIGRNITERKEVEDVLAIQKQRLDDILEGTNAGTWDWNVQTGELTLNERWAEIIGYTLKELEPIDVNTWINNVHTDDLPIANALLDKIFNRETNYYDVVFRQPHKDGRWVWINARGKVIEWTDDDKPLRTSGIHIDITERKMAEEKLKIRNIELETWAEVTTNRELFMLNLKKEINELLEKSGEKPKYEIPI